MSIIRNTPWGVPQHQTEVAPGIVSVSTASHGGIVLSAERWVELLKVFPTFTPFAGDLYLEEDADWSVAALVWPELFSAAEVYVACTMARYMKNVDISRAPKAREIAAAYLAENAERYRHVCAWTSGKGWSVTFVKLSNSDDQITVSMPRYPDKPLYDRSELAAIEETVG